MKIAIVILGQQNSGKSTTLRYLVNTYTRKDLSLLRYGWQQLEPFDEIMMLKLHSYFIPASPSETNYKLVDRFKDLGYTPEILFVAEQTDGRHRESTFQFLKENDYRVLKFPLSNEFGEGIWDRFKKNTEEEEKKLNDRTQEIIAKLKEEIKAVLV
ncbi:hypothetical protein [Marinifilum flexuosum]|uniref:hypothetical protein n=1 Tax=Marinifilum flexuosum TaxID=1117708 RepID=UPI00249422DB|nr:hypothetical protein [Marinifilum flexuosum]